MRALITHLDTPMNNGGDTQVIYLSYASAKDLVPILQGVASTLTGEAPPGKQAAAAAGAAPSSAAAGPSTATIQAHEEDNALVISAPPAVFRSLAAVVRQLDIRRATVLIEAVIAEVSSETAKELGVQWQFPIGDGNNHFAGGTNFTRQLAGQQHHYRDAGPQQSATVRSLSVGNGLQLGYFDTISVNGKPVVSIGALLSALQSNTSNNVLSTPSVMTLDNQEAMIKVAEEVPFVTGSYTTQTSGTTAGTGSTRRASAIRSRPSSARTSASRSRSRRTSPSAPTCVWTSIRKSRTCCRRCRARSIWSPASAK